MTKRGVKVGKNTGRGSMFAKLMHDLVNPMHRDLISQIYASEERSILIAAYLSVSLARKF